MTPPLYSHLLSVVMSLYDRVLILGNFTIHVCCPSFTTDWIHLFESLNLVQSVNGPSHTKGHTLDLVLSHGLSLNKLHMLDIPVSDHKAVIFQTQLPTPVPKPNPPSFLALLICPEFPPGLLSCFH